MLSHNSAYPFIDRRNITLSQTTALLPTTPSRPPSQATGPIVQPLTLRLHGSACPGQISPVIREGDVTIATCQFLAGPY